MPPASLISSAAILIPCSMLTPIAADRPVNGPMTPIRIGSAARAGANENAQMPASRPSLINFIAFTPAA